MLAALATLLVCQLAGEAIVRAFDLPVPGPVAGMALLFFALVARAPIPKETAATAEGLLQHLSLLFVPAGVGVVQHLALLGSQGAQIVAVVLLSTAITLTVTALTFEYLARFMQVDEAADEHEAREQGPEKP
jgi:holin-like protein